MKTMNAKKTAIAQAMSKPEGYSLEDDFSPESQDEPQNKKTASRKLKNSAKYSLIFNARTKQKYQILSVNAVYLCNWNIGVRSC